MGKKLFWSRDRIVNHEFDCLGLGLWIASEVESGTIFEKFVLRNEF